MKKYIALFLALCIFCLPLGACEGEKAEEDNKSRLMAEVQQEQAEASAAAEKKANEGKDILRVVTDIDCRSKMMGKPSQASQGKRTFETILEYFGGTPSGIEVELNILPQDQGGAYDSELTHIRTEIAAGEGPDVFLMSGFGGPYEGYGPANTLFQSPEAAMKKGLFLPLDSYMENAQHMDFDKLDQKVMEAGRNERGQVILPMFYRLHQACVFQKVEPEALPKDWESAAEEENERLLETFALGLAATGFREMAFGQIADWDEEELLLDKNAFYQRVQEAVDAYGRALPHLKTLNTMDYNEMTKEIYGQVDAWTNNVALGREKYTSYVFRNERGEINAPIETWCAVNANTKHPEDAFFIVDCLLSKEFLGQEAFWLKMDSGKDSHDQMTFFWLAGEDCVPVHTGLLSSPKGHYKYVDALTSAQRDALKEARQNIGYAYFTSNIDREIDRTVQGLLEQLYDGGELTGEEVRKACDKCYTTLKMMLAES